MTTHLGFANTPEPPYYAAIFSSLRTRNGRQKIDCRPNRLQTELKRLFLDLVFIKFINVAEFAF